jgi:capsular polysaccharide biosynthesis protein
MNLADELADSLWSEIEQASTERNYPRLHLLYSVLAKLRPINFHESEHELLRLMGIELPSLTSDAVLDHEILDLNLENQTLQFFDTCEPIQELCPAFTLPAHKINVLNRPDAKWANVSPTIARQVMLRVIRQARVVVGSSIVSSGATYFADWSAKSRPYLSRQIRDFEATLSRPPSDPINIESAVYLCHSHSSNWGHFWREVATRISMLEAAGHPAQRTTLLLDDRLPETAKQLIKLLIPDNVSTTFIAHGSLLEIKELLVIDLPIFRQAEIASESHDDELNIHSFQRHFKFIERRVNEIGTSVSDNKSRKIFWSRSDGNQRDSKLLESILQGLATSYGFETVVPSQLSIHEQISIARSAVISFGAYGSWLNLLATFAKPESKHLVITNDRPYECRHLFTSCLDRGLDLQIAEGQRTFPLPFYNPNNYHSATIPTSSMVEGICRWLNTTAG